MTLFISGIIISFIGVLALRFTANAQTHPQTLLAALFQAISTAIMFMAIIDVVAAHEKAWWYVGGIGVGTYLSIRLQKRYETH